MRVWKPRVELRKRLLHTIKLKLSQFALLKTPPKQTQKTRLSKLNLRKITPEKSHKELKKSQKKTLRQVERVCKARNEAVTGKEGGEGQLETTMNLCSLFRFRLCGFFLTSQKNSSLKYISLILKWDTWKQTTTNADHRHHRRRWQHWRREGE